MIDNRAITLIPSKQQDKTMMRQSSLPGQVTGNPTIITLRPRQNGRHFADNILKCIFLIENIWNSINISLKFVRKGRINNISLVQIMAWRRAGDKPLSEPTMVSLPTHICVTRPQWVMQTVQSWGLLSHNLWSDITLVTTGVTPRDPTSRDFSGITIWNPTQLLSLVVLSPYLFVWMYTHLIRDR